ncbi:MAG: AEC family transporter, partial [Sulfuricella sp.]|nr:AEC family transporter [Sulfuricella sp.]
MTNLIRLVACFLLGMALRHGGRLPESAPATLNSFIIHISLPALTLLYIHDIHLTPAFAYVAAMAWLHFCLGAGFFWLAGRILKL